jgi:hypothetical protein
MNRPRAIDTILIGGGTAGVLDIADAFIVTAIRGGSPIRVLQFIASGVLGSGAFQGGLTTAALGLLFHFAIAFAAAATYFAAALWIPALTRRPIVCGVLFGVAVYVFMNAVVLPLAGFNVAFPTWPNLANGLAIHAFGVGLPIALLASRSARR